MSRSVQGWALLGMVCGIAVGTGGALCFAYYQDTRNLTAGLVVVGIEATAMFAGQRLGGLYGLRRKYGRWTP